MRRVLRRSKVPGAPARRRVVDRLQKPVINPLDKIAFALGMPPPGDALLETTGRRAGRARVTPVCDGTDGGTFWVVAQHGHAADYVLNIEADPRVRLRAACRAPAGGPERRTSTTTIPRDAYEYPVVAIAGVSSAFRPRPRSRPTP
jgi:deazaflavin-dependent oxidoreductase (nitroreductase family)